MNPLLILLFPMVLFWSACTSTPAPEDVLYYSRRFKAPFEEVWRATQQAMLNYPMNTNMVDSGQLQTLYITGKYRYKPPHLEHQTLPSGFQYRLNIQIIKKENSCRVEVAKEVRLQKDFFSEPVALKSQGFEEKMILYRIRRELLLERLLKRKLKNQNQ